MSEDKILKAYAAPTISVNSPVCNMGECEVTGTVTIIRPEGELVQNAPRVQLHFPGQTPTDATLSNSTSSTSQGVTTSTWDFTFSNVPQGNTYTINAEFDINKTWSVSAPGLPVTC